MVKILTTAQIREADAETIRSQQLNSVDLMERASEAFVQWFIAHLPVTKKVSVVCGTGNNGGDGLAIARLLHGLGYRLEVFVISVGEKVSPDFQKNHLRYSKKGTVQQISDEASMPDLSGTDVVIDAIFGSGLSRPVTGLYEKVIERINQTDAIRVAVDIPSGLLADAPSGGTIVEADYTVSFQIPKLSFFLPESYQYTGTWTLVDIGLDKEFIRSSSTPWHFLQPKDVSKLLLLRHRFDHKGSFGHALIVAGSEGKIGAAVLATKAALRSGAGLVSTHIPRCGYNIVQTSAPEAMVHLDPHDKFVTALPDLEPYKTVAMGPGIGKSQETLSALRELLKTFSRPIILDADALNLLSENKELIGALPPGSILTPHPREFERLVGEANNGFHRLEQLRALAAKIKGCVILKGGYTAIAMHDGTVYFNSTGNPGMATGGTGDVLTGVLAGLLARGYTSEHCCLLGVYLHGLSADLAVVENGMESLIAGDVIKFLPAAFKKLNRL